jgi:hypothetical protein
MALRSARTRSAPSSRGAPFIPSVDRAPQGARCAATMA